MRSVVPILPRHLTKYARQVVDTFPIMVIQGARQVGKSTFAAMVVEDRPSVTYTLDDPHTLAAAKTDGPGFLGQHPDDTVIIDEVQRLPDLVLALKANVDRDRRPGRFILTGSADLLRLPGTPDSLAGRAVTVELRGLSRGEIARRPEDFCNALTRLDRPTDFTTRWTRHDYIDALAAGGYPEIRDMSARLRRSWLDSYLKRITTRDSLDVHHRTEPERLASLLRLLAANQSGELVKARLASSANIPASTITTYLDIARTLLIIDELPPWTGNLTGRETGRRKAFVTDSALALRLAGVAGEKLRTTIGNDHIGGMLEAFVVSELLKQREWSDSDFTIHHYRDRNGLEVDIVLELPDGRVVGIEVKSSTSFRGDHFNGLRKFAEKLGDRFLLGIVLNTGTAGYRYTENLWGLPISALWEL